MQRIDAILDLALSIEPIQKDGHDMPDFFLCRCRGKWEAKVQMRKCFALAEDHETPEAALDDLYEQLLNLNRSLLARIKDRLARWAGTKSVLRAVKEDEDSA